MLTSAPMSSATVPIWIVLISYKQLDDVKRVLTALSKQEHPPAGIVLVDNGSNGDAVEWVKGNHPEVELVEAGKNLGFATGNNVGAERAIELGAEWLLLLNTDTEPEPGFLGDFWDAVQEHPGYGAYQPLITYGDGETIWSVGGKINPITMLSKPSYAYENIETAPDESEELDYATGCAFLTTADIWRRTGGFWSGLFMYYEDTELSFRIKSLGYGICYVPGAKLVHHTPIDNAEKFTKPYSVYYLTRNRLKMVFFYGKFKLWGFVRAFLGDAIKSLAFVVKRRNLGAALAVVDGWADFIAGREGV
ncbi:MAG: glycosyltransferase family 2 protein [bacterium]|nr:glycosyltransferase family 2 protein [bacterium]